MTFLFLLIFAPPLLVVYALTIFGRRSFGRIRASSSFVPLTLAYLVPLVPLLWGTIMSYSGPMGTEPRWPLHILLSLDALVLLFYAYLIWWYAGVRLFASVALSAALWLCLWADFIAGCLLTND